MRKREFLHEWLTAFAIVLALGLASCDQKPEEVTLTPPTPQAQAQPQPQAPQREVAQSLPTTILHIGNGSLETQIAATPAQQETGLMYRTSLGDNEGMIFLLGGPSHASFWMKNTLIPLSVAFIDKDGVILEIHDMQPAMPGLPDNQIPTTNSVSDQICYALETNIHWFSLNGIKPGDKIAPAPSTLAPTAAH